MSLNFWLIKLIYNNLGIEASVKIRSKIVTGECLQMGYSQRNIKESFCKQNEYRLHKILCRILK